MSPRTTGRRRGNRDGAYVWADHTEIANITVERLSDDAYLGLELAEQLAFNSRLRAYPINRPPKLTLEEVAARYGVSPQRGRRLIALARRRLFGSLSDAGIRKRIQRHPDGRDERPCAEPGCGELIPAAAPGMRRYCDHHRTNKERTRRSRRRARERAAAG